VLFHAVLGEFAGDTAAAEKILELELECGDQSEVVEQGRTQQPRYTSDALHGTFGEFAGADEPLAEFR